MYSMSDSCIDTAYAYPIDEDSDSSDNSSADESQAATLLKALVPVRKCPPSICRPNTTRDDAQESSSEDEFEKEMSSELNRTMKNIETKLHNAVTKADPMEQGSTDNGTTAKGAYDQQYFDSDSDEDETSEEKKKKVHPVPSDDELLYDPAMDDEDQNWVNKQRLGYLTRQPPPQGRTVPPGHDGKRRQPPGLASTGAKSVKLPESDAVLNCPACMSLLSLDCQRHQQYYHQYRAMFVSNCLVDTTEVLRFPGSKSPTANRPNKKQRKQWKRKSKRDKTGSVIDDQEGGEDSTGMSTNTEGELGNSRETVGIDCDQEEVYNPVRCSECNTEVGVYDKDEIYHFFNVLSSYA